MGVSRIEAPFGRWRAVFATLSASKRFLCWSGYRWKHSCCNRHESANGDLSNQRIPETSVVSVRIQPSSSKSRQLSMLCFAWSVEIQFKHGIYLSIYTHLFFDTTQLSLVVICCVQFDHVLHAYFTAGEATSDNWVKNRDGGYHTTADHSGRGLQIFVHTKYLLNLIDSLNNIHIWQLSPQLHHS